MIITLPWPPSVLNPNVKKHWTVKSKAAKKHKDDCYWCTQSAKDEQGVPYFTTHTIPLRVTLHPPDKRPRDVDNAIASCKYLFDGIALALGVNDSRFRPQFDKDWGEVVKHGQVIVELKEEVTG